MVSEAEKTDVLLVGAGIMSATLSALLRLVEPTCLEDFLLTRSSSCWSISLSVSMDWA